MSICLESRDVLIVCQLCHTVLTFDFEASATSASTNVQADMSGWCHATLLRLSHGVRSRRLEVNQQSSQVKALSSRWLGKECENVRERSQFRINSRVPSWSIPDFPNCFFGRVSSFLVILVFESQVCPPGRWCCIQTNRMQKQDIEQLKPVHSKRLGPVQNE